MLITVILKDELVPLVAPLGAAAFFVQDEGDTASVIFAMMRKGETGIDTLNRVMDEESALGWEAVAARPEEQRLSDFGPDAYIKYDLIYEGGGWRAASADLANYLRVLSLIQNMPKSPPRALGTTLEAFKGPKKPVMARPR